MPFERPLHTLGDEVVLDSGDYAGLLDEGARALRLAEAAPRALPRAAAPAKRSAQASRCSWKRAGSARATACDIAVEPSGEIEVVTGGASLGQGFETVMAQICADALGVDYRRVRVVHGQTNRIEHGIGAHATRATVMTGSATHIAAPSCAHSRSRWPRSCCRRRPMRSPLWRGCVQRKDEPGGPVARARRVANLRGSSSERPRPGRPKAGFTTEHMTYPYGVHIAVVAIERDTGRVEVERYLSPTMSAARSIPMLVEGQLVGGLAQGLGGALSEEFVYDDRGEPLSTTFADYLVPTAREVPAVDVLLTEDAPARATRSASRAPAKAASTRSAPRSRPRSTTPSGGPARSLSCR